MKNCILAFFLVSHFPIIGQNMNGCRDVHAINFNSSATTSDYSCLYDTISIDILPQNRFPLPNYLSESSGLCIFNNLVWTHNDDHTSKIFGIDKANGRVVDSIDFGVNIVDWEDLQYLEGKFYIGDFGNNGNGIRSNLRVLRFDLATQILDTINFSYVNQFDFEIASSNETNFDCEAFLVTDSMIYLFTKRWNDFQTELHAIPNRVGSHRTVFKGIYNCEGLITGSTFTSDGIVLVGYTSLLAPFLIELKDFQGDDFFRSNKRRYYLNLPFHQVEAITFDRVSEIYTITNEQFSFLGQIIPAKLSNFIIDRESSLTVSITNNNLAWFIFDSLTNHLAARHDLISIEIVNNSGQIVYKGNVDLSGCSLTFLMRGSYLIYNMSTGQVERISIQ